MFQVCVYHVDITELQCDVLVNTANHQLKHHGGLANVIHQKGSFD